MTDPELREQVASDIVLMKLVGINPVIVHGGGPEITSYMKRLGLKVEFYDGLRVTTDEAMEVVKMVLVGKVNPELVAAINQHGRLAVGVSGDDGNLVTRHAARPAARARRRRDRDRHDRHRQPHRGRLHPGRRHGGCRATTAAASTSTPISVAAELAAALGADKVIFLTDVDGLYADFADKSSLISALTPDEAEEMIVERPARGRHGAEGRRVRARAARRRGRAHILNGTVPHALLLEVYTDEGVGTMIADPPRRSR